MRNANLDKLFAEKMPRLAAHWKACIKDEREGHDAKTHAAVGRHIQEYLKTLKAAPDPASEETILAAIKALFLGLDQVNEKSGGSMLENDERELLVPIVVASSELAGLNLSAFENRDPTAKYRSF